MSRMHRKQPDPPPRAHVLDDDDDKHSARPSYHRPQVAPRVFHGRSPGVYGEPSKGVVGADTGAALTASPRSLDRLDAALNGFRHVVMARTQSDARPATPSLAPGVYAAPS